MMRKDHHSAGEWTKPCVECGKEMKFVYYCHMKTREFCSKKCASTNKKRLGVVNQYGVCAPWSEKEDKILVEKFPNSPQPKILAKEMNRSYWSVIRRVKELGIERTMEATREGYSIGGRKNKGRKRPDLILNRKKNLSGADNPFYGKTHTQETRRSISESQKKKSAFFRLNNDPEFQKRRMKALHAKPNKPEIIVETLLEEIYPGEYKYVGNGQYIVDRMNPDFVSTDETKIIEVFGETFHDPNISPRPIKDRSTEKGRIKALSDLGFRTLIIWSKEIYKGGEDGRKRLKDKIKRFHEGCEAPGGLV